MKYKSQIVYFFLAIPLIAIVVFFYGWERTVYHENDAEIGKKIIFNVPMLSISNLTGGMVKSYIRNNYDAFLIPKDEWKDMKIFYEDAIDVEMPCDTVFEVVSAFSIVPTGILTRAFSSSTIKFYTLKTNTNSKKFALMGVHYGNNAKNTSSDNITRGCVQ